MAMNTWSGIGRLTADPEVRYGRSGNAVATFDLAVARDFHTDNEPDTDFFHFVAFGKSAEFIEKYFQKGMQVGIVGRLKNEEWTDQNGNKRLTTKIVVEKQYFCEKKSESSTAASNKNTRKAPAHDEDGFMHVPDGIDEELPFS